MDVTGEVASIVVMVVTLVVGLLVLGWAYGDFEAPRKVPPADQPPAPPAPS